MDRPSVCILLTTHNGEPWLEAQLESLAGQTDVDASVVVSDDASSDATRDLLAQVHRGLPIHALPAASTRFGNANRNFLRLIRDTPPAGAQYFALCDQDDIWLPDKLHRAIDELERTGADVYSSNVVAFWEDGTERVLFKSGPQRQYDYLFESAGPGCTFVFRREVFVKLQNWLTREFDRLQTAPVHDWLIYAHARRQGWRWHIDDRPTMRYRQHARNEVGANTGIRAALARWKQIRSGRYRRNALAVAAAVEDDSPVHLWLRRLSPLDRIRLAFHCTDCRRRKREALVLAVCFVALFPKN